MIQAASFINCQLNRMLGPRGEPHLSRRITVSTPGNKFDGLAYLLQFDTQVIQYLYSDSFTSAYKPKEQLFCAYVIVLEASCFLLDQRQHLTRSTRQLVSAVTS